jgi:hypothetical protein
MPTTSTLVADPSAAVSVAEGAHGRDTDPRSPRRHDGEEEGPRRSPRAARRRSSAGSGGLIDRRTHCRACNSGRPRSGPPVGVRCRPRRVSRRRGRERGQQGRRSAGRRIRPRNRPRRSDCGRLELPLPVLDPADRHRRSCDWRVTTSSPHPRTWPPSESASCRSRCSS